MNHQKLKEKAEKILALADIKINGDRPWDIRVHDERFYARVFSQGSLGFGESYMDGWWECEHIDQLIERVYRARLVEQVQPFRFIGYYLTSIILNRQDGARAYHIGEAHYDAGNDLYHRMLGSTMAYTCGYWKNASTLDEAQDAKLDLTCKKIGLKHGDHVLDIGCGWGSFAKFAAERYGARVTGITVSHEQVKLGMERCKGLPVELRYQDYRDVQEQFDHVVSLGMFEHVGPKNYRAYFEVAKRCLRPGGLFLLHTIGGLKSTNHTDPWIEKYIFPNSVLPSAIQIARAVEGLFVTEDWHNFGAHYDKTLMAWADNCERAWPDLSAYDERFRRMWRFYLRACAGMFRARYTQLWQIVFSARGVNGGYTSIR